MAQQDIKFKIVGYVGPEFKSNKVNLLYILDDKVVKDSTLIENNSFSFSGKVPWPVKAYLSFSKLIPSDGSPNLTVFFLEKGKVKITIPDFPSTAEIKGGKSNDLNNRLQSSLAFLNNQRKCLIDIKNIQKGRNEKENQKIVKTIDSLLDINQVRRNTQLLKFIKENPGSIVSLDALGRLYSEMKIDFVTIQSIFNSLSSNLKKSRAARSLTKSLEVAKALSIGNFAPDFTQNDTLGKPVSLSDFRGKYVLVDFWASWCGPCRAENPNVVKAFQKYKDKGFTVLGVSLDRPGARQAWMDAIHKDQLWWVQVSDLKGWDNEVAKLYDIKAIPQNLLIGPGGKIIAKNIRGDALQEKLAEILD